jgi:hypothetical protein
MMSPKHATRPGGLVLLSPKLARPSRSSASVPAAAPAAAAMQQLLGGCGGAASEAAAAAGACPGGLAADLCRGLTSRIISLCISPFRPGRAAPAAALAAESAEAAAPLLGERLGWCVLLLLFFRCCFGRCAHGSWPALACAG